MHVELRVIASCRQNLMICRDPQNDLHVINVVTSSSLFLIFDLTPSKLCLCVLAFSVFVYIHLQCLSACGPPSVSCPGAWVDQHGPCVAGG